jgi:hypothetical protein
LANNSAAAFAGFAVLALLAVILFDLAFELPNWLTSLVIGAIGAWFVLNIERENRAPKPTKKAARKFSTWRAYSAKARPPESQRQRVE